MTPDGTPAGSGGGAADPGADVAHLVHRRDLQVPEEDREPLAEYWTHMRQLRAAVDEQWLADSEIAVTWTAAEAPDAS